MKMKQHNILFSILTFTATVGCMTSCADNQMESLEENGFNSDSNSITFTIAPESKQIATREGNSGGENWYEKDYVDWFSDGSHADKLIFAVYKYDEETQKYSLDNSFNKEGQTNSFCQNEFLDISYPFSLKVIPEPGKTYRIVFWAQCNETEAFNTEDLENIVVDYDKLAMNDEHSDAFSAMVEFTSESVKNQNVILKRPLAQINIGSSGWDYEGKAILKPNPQVIKYSTVTVKGVANRFNALNDVVIKESEGLEVDFKWNVIPAYRKYVYDNSEAALDKVDDQYINDLSHFMFSPEDNEKPAFDLDEIYLKVDIDRDDAYSNYIGWYEYKSKTDNFFNKVNQSFEGETLTFDESELNKEIATEYFKYLATCNVLVPGIAKNDGDKNESYGSTVDVEFKCSDERPQEDASGATIEGTPFSFKITTVPVNRNWRTNIVSATGSALFMEGTQFRVDVYPEEFGDYYKRLSATDQNWSNSDGNEKDETQGGQDNDGYEWPEDDIFGHFVPSLGTLTWSTGVKNSEWHPLKQQNSNFLDLTFEIDPIEFKNESDSQKVKYSYKVYAEYNGIKYEDEPVIKVEIIDGSKHKVTLSKDSELLDEVYQNTDNSFDIVVQAFKENGDPLTEPSRSKVYLDWEFNTGKPSYAWIFSSKTDKTEDSLGGQNVYGALFNASLSGEVEKKMDDYLTIKSREGKKISALNDCINLGGGGSTDYLHLRFTVFSTCVVEVEYATASDDANGRYIEIKYGDTKEDEIPGELSKTKTEKKTVTATIQIDAENTTGKTVYVYSGGKAVNVYSIKLKPVD